ncbi:MAG: ATP-binding protein [Muribaculaceae bacterium]|nr:ATP-binding protein [Muribaculaceae bacterium]
MEFVDRKDEYTRLKEALNMERPSMVVIYGRRRLGKSTLIKRVIAEEDIYFLADRSEKEHQILLLAKIFSQIFPDFDKVTYPDWESIFMAANYRTENKFTLVIDEFPYLVEQSPDLPSVIQKLIDNHILKYNIVLCGSSQNMMYGMFLDSSAPLYGRADEIMKLTPLRLPFIGEALGLNAVNAIEEYAVWGGIPRYWELRERRASLDSALWKNVFSVNAPLYEEPIKLFQDDIKDIVKTSTILSFIGTGANRLSEIAARCNQPATNLSRPLRKLLDLGILEKEIPFGVDEKNSKKSLYKISDPFLAFYYHFVVPNLSFIQLDRKEPIERMLDQQFSQYIGLQWEKICRDAVTGNIIDNVLYGKAGRWWGSVMNEEHKPEQIELDIVCESIDKKYLLVGECKWTTGENVSYLTAELIRKAKLIRKH